MDWKKRWHKYTPDYWNEKRIFAFIEAQIKEAKDELAQLENLQKEFTQLVSPYREGYILGQEDMNKHIDTLMEKKIKEAEERVITEISRNEGWEDSEDFYRKKFGFPLKYNK
ncbi:MAG: hypothetical protein V1759_00060 [bacterium]